MFNYRFFIFWSLLILPAQGIYISEVYSNPYGQEGVNGSTGEGLEWIEITNPNGIGFSMNGYTIADLTSVATTTNRFRIGMLTIPPGGSVVFSGLPLATFNATYGVSLTVSQYYEIPATPLWSASSNLLTGMSNGGWLNNTTPENLRIYTDQAGTTELVGSYRPSGDFSSPNNGDSFYWDGVSSNWLPNTAATAPPGLESGNASSPFFASPGVATVPEISTSWLALAGAFILLGFRRR